MKVQTSIAGAVSLLVLSASCMRGTPAVGGASPAWDDSVTVTIINDNFYDANIYALYVGATRDRLGMVTGHSTETFRVRYQPKQLVMWMHLIGVGVTVSNEIGVDPGDELELRIMPDAHRKVVRGRE